ncbi:alpha-glucosidase [Rhizomicrobium palustre]|uniref:Alpha-glucosidase n=2 Tax=Rhizomicrobium palustre TaxID=189966 RepID=A0A846MWG0_9PROT|nr:glycoside hydrolase family 97 protein [Rhizomicrobium palustre]NIK87491.1 alpha-glucosidase [Rhizomicrobium palustre]
MMKALLAALAMAALILPLRAETVASVASPGKVLSVSISIDGDGRPTYSVSRQGKPVIAESRLGFLLTDAPKLERNLTLASSEVTPHDETWEQPWGEWRFIRNSYNELRLHLKEKIAPGRKLDIVFRVYDDGVGFRYEFPDQAALKNVHIGEELTEFAVADPAEAWWEVGGEWNRYEQLYQHTRLDQVSQAHTPLTVKTDKGLYIAFHEAALVDYAGMWLRRVDGQRLKSVLSPSSQHAAKVTRLAPFNTPWRTMIIADSAPALYMSHLELNLNEPNALGDVKWVKPYKYVGIWWSMHLGLETWGSGPHHGATTENTKRYIDFAAANGFKEVLVEGWNYSWDDDWFANGHELSYTKPYPDFDIKEVAAYAKSKGVKIIGHHETFGKIDNYEAQLPAALDLLASLGYDSIKTGYVADAGGLRVKGPDDKLYYEYHDGQASSVHHLKVVTEAAKRHIAVVDHEPIKDTGLRRTYPNWVSREGARGQEYNAWGNPPNPPNHESLLFFTRMLAGPFDFTPGALSLTGKGGQKIQNTIAHQLADYIVIYSPVEMACDLPENYAKYAAAFQFIKDVPTDWQDTQVLAGEPGEYVALARKDRKSNNWYLGAVGDNSKRSLTVKLDFLDKKHHWVAETYLDGKDADWDLNPHAIDIAKRDVKPGETLTLNLARGGGAAIRFVAK